ncbi:glutathione S-transferase C-terminal-like protein [Melanogaster broomeanus]|nr:glutathione S-transferase C-terminal-like protein [Melanogaster broomeanus]
MAPIGTLWGVAIQRQSKVILAAAAVAGLELDNPAVEFGVTNQTPEYLGKFPWGSYQPSKIPRALNCSKERQLLAMSGLLGNSANEAALVDQWVHFGESEIATFSYETLALVAGYLGPYSKERQARALKFLDEHLASSTSGFLIADRMTLADIAVAGVSQQAGRITCGSAERAQYPNVFAHYEKVTAHPKVKAVFGEAEFVEDCDGI